MGEWSTDQERRRILGARLARPSDGVVRALRDEPAADGTRVIATDVTDQLLKGSADYPLE